MRRKLGDILLLVLGHRLEVRLVEARARELREHVVGRLLWSLGVAHARPLVQGELLQLAGGAALIYDHPRAELFHRDALPFLLGQLTELHVALRAASRVEMNCRSPTLSDSRVVLDVAPGAVR